MNDDPQLLRRYAEEKSEAAFAELVRRHVNFVYGVALRRLGGDAHAAEDATQQVFTALARQAAALVKHPVLNGWLYTATRNVTGQMVRTARRQQQREQEAHAMNPESSRPEWEKLRPVLDDALDELRDEDRVAVLLRFFEGRSFAEVGAKLRLTDNAARMRVDRALEKMHVALGRRGVTSTTAALGLALASQAAATAPAGLATVVTGTALAGAGGAAITTAATFMSMTKLQMGVAAAIAVAGTTGYVMQAHNEASLRTELNGLRGQEREVAVLRQENETLTRTATEVVDLRHDDVELVQLRTEAEALRVKQQAAARIAARTADLSVVYDIRQLDQIPTFQSRVPPKYPVEMRQAGQGGEVLVEFIVDANGATQKVSAVRSTNPAFEGPAVEAIKAWTFRPGLKSRVPVNTTMQVPIVFTLEPPKNGQKTQPTPSWF